MSSAFVWTEHSKGSKNCDIVLKLKEKSYTWFYFSRIFLELNHGLDLSRHKKIQAGPNWEKKTIYVRVLKASLIVAEKY